MRVILTAVQVLYSGPLNQLLACAGAVCVSEAELFGKDVPQEITISSVVKTTHKGMSSRVSLSIASLLVVSGRSSHDCEHHTTRSLIVMVGRVSSCWAPRRSGRW